MSHEHHDLFENRRQFQLERMILFSDAVFAIAITLLVIEIRIPELQLNKYPRFIDAFQDAMLDKIPEFLGFILSFAVIGQFWVSHHRLFGYVNDFDGGLLWLNLHMLFWIVMVPFSSSLNSKYGGWNVVWMWYSFNMFMIGLSLFFIWKYIGNPKRKLSVLAHEPLLLRMAKSRSVTISVIFLSGLLLSIPGKDFLFWPSRLVYILIFPAMKLISHRYKPKK